MNDIEMLNCILQNAEMGCQGITNIRRMEHSMAVDRVLCDQLARYGRFYGAAHKMLTSRGEKAKHISPVVKTMTRIAAGRDLQRDASASHIAEMMIKGSTMGVNKLVRRLRDYNRQNPGVTLRNTAQFKAHGLPFLIPSACPKNLTAQSAHLNYAALPIFHTKNRRSLRSTFPR